MVYSASSAEQVRATRLLLQQRQAEAAQIEQQREAAQLAVKQLQQQLSHAGECAEHHSEQAHAAAASTQSAQHDGHTRSQHTGTAATPPPHSAQAQNSNLPAAAAGNTAAAANILPVRSVLAALITSPAQSPMHSDAVDMDIDAASARNSFEEPPQSSPQLRRIPHTQQRAALSVAVTHTPSAVRLRVLVRAIFSCL